jgi:hypothetical protein
MVGLGFEVRLCACMAAAMLPAAVVAQTESEESTSRPPLVIAEQGDFYVGGEIVF